MGSFNPFRFDGRIGRLQYLGYGIVWGIVLLVVRLMITGGTGDPNNASAGGTLFLLVLALAFLIATLSYGTRRLHDFNQSGWLYLLMFVPFVNIVLGLILVFVPGTKGPNSYGARAS